MLLTQSVSWYDFYVYTLDMLKLTLGLLLLLVAAGIIITVPPSNIYIIILLCFLVATGAGCLLWNFLPLKTSFLIELAIGAFGSLYLIQALDFPNTLILLALLLVLGIYIRT